MVKTKRGKLMKKLMIFALSAMVAVSASAQDVFKQAKKIKDAAELAQLINANPSMPDQEKAQCYELLVKLYNQKVVKEGTIMTENSLNIQMKKPEVPYDTIGFYNAAYEAMAAGVLCDKYDQLPNLKGKVAPKYRKELGDLLYPMRNHLLNGGIHYNDKGDNKNVFKFFSAFVDSKDYPMFAEVDPKLQEQVNKPLPQIAFYAGAYASQLDLGADIVNKYCDIAAADPQYKKDAEGVRTQYAAKGLKTHEDSVAYAQKLEAMYEKDPTNVQTFQQLAMVQLGLNEGDKFFALCQKRIDAMPNDHLAYYFRGQIRCMLRMYKEALPDLEKADELKPNDAGINAMIGQSHMGLAEDAENRAAGKSGIIPVTAKGQIKPVWDKALDYLNKAKSLDTDGSNERLYKSKISQIQYHLESDYKNVQ